MPLYCPIGIQGPCSECPQCEDFKCLIYHPSMPLQNILTPEERLGVLEKEQPSPAPLPRYDVQHLQAQINWLEKRLQKVEARKKRYTKY